MVTSQLRSDRDTRKLLGVTTSVGKEPLTNYHWKIGTAALVGQLDDFPYAQ